MQWTYDLTSGWRATRNGEGLEVVRPCLVKGITAVNGATGTDPELPFKIEGDAGFPGYGTAYPTTRSPWNACTLQDISLRGWQTRTSALVDLIYRARAVSIEGVGTASTWSLTRSPQISHVQTYATATGGLITVWYKSGTASSVTSKPSGADAYTGAVHKMEVNSVLRASALLTGAQWNAYKVAVRAVEGTINNAPWGSSPLGTWFFVAPTTTTNDYGKTFRVQLDFLENKKTWYPFLKYFDYKGKHPEDAAPESAFTGFPTYGAIITRNGVTQVSAQGEANFATGFAFTPDDA